MRDDCTCSNRYKEKCPKWAIKGYCTHKIFGSYMETFCQYTCGKCEITLE